MQVQRCRPLGLHARHLDQAGPQTFEGIGVEKNRSEAIKWWMAAEQGHAKSQYTLAAMLKANGTETDMREALNWYRKAAKQGDANAQEALDSLSTKTTNSKSP